MFLHKWMRRRVWRISGGVDIAARFVKDASGWKTGFPSGVVRAGGSVPEGDYWCSEVVKFVNEWRYYVAAGEVVTTGWYDGEDENKPAPELPVDWPSNFSGAVDFGELEDGTIALVECHAPFACGWYGEDGEHYVRWLIDSRACREWWWMGLDSVVVLR